jgi:Rieske Fe-S protein
MNEPSDRNAGSAQLDDPRAFVDIRIDTPGREGLTGTTPASIYKPLRDPEQVSIPPDGRPLEQQPRWRQDFPIDWPQDHYVARRDFTKFMVLTSFAFVVGQFWIIGQNYFRRRAGKPPIKRIASLGELSVGQTLMFHYPDEADHCILIRLPVEGEEETRRQGDREMVGHSPSSVVRLVAYSQKCTHLTCAVIPDVERGVIHCPCHEGLFDLTTGNVLAGPPPRPLPRILLEIRGDDVYATGVERRTA